MPVGSYYLKNLRVFVKALKTLAKTQLCRTLLKTWHVSQAGSHICTQPHFPGSTLHIITYTLRFIPGSSLLFQNSDSVAVLNINGIRNLIPIPIPVLKTRPLL